MFIIDKEEIKISDLIPPFWSSLSINNEDKLIFLGSNTISKVVGIWRAEVEKCARNISNEQARAKTLLESSSAKRPRKGISYKKAKENAREWGIEKNKAAEAVRILESFKKRAEVLEGVNKKPCMPFARPYYFFSVGKKIKIFNSNKWLDAEISGDRECDELYSYVSVKFTDSSEESGRRLYPIRHPVIARPSELEYLKYHLDFAFLWTRAIKLFPSEVDPEAMLEAIKKAE